MKILTTATTALILAFAISAITGATSADAGELGQPFRIPTEPATVAYKIHSAKVLKGNVIEVVSERNSQGFGVTFSKRLIDCKAGTFRYVVDDAETLSQAEKGKASTKVRMDPLSSGSISSYIAGEACMMLALPKLGK